MGRVLLYLFLGVLCAVARVEGAEPGSERQDGSRCAGAGATASLDKITLRTDLSEDEEGKISRLKRDLGKDGIERKTVDSIFNKGKFGLYDIGVALFSANPEKVSDSEEKTYEWYREYLGLEEKVAGAREFMKDHTDALADAEKKYGVDSLIDSGLDAIIFAMDGADRETYEKFRHKGDFDKMLDNLRLLIKRRMEKGADSPVINLRMVVTRENEDQVSRMREFAAGVGVDMLSLKTLGSHDDETLWNENLPRNHEYRRYEYDDAGEAIRKRNTCKRMWHHPFIHSDGTVAPCCYHLAGEVPVGNAFASNGAGFSKVWFGEEYRRARAGFMAFRGGDGHAGPERCRTCNTNYTNNWDYVSHSFDLRDNGKTS